MNQKLIHAFLGASLMLSPVFGQVALYTENFEGSTSTFQLNTMDVNSNTFGENYWDINNAYTGGTVTALCLGTPLGTVTVPNTPAQPAGIPSQNGKYMHIVAGDAVNVNVLNASYKAADGLCVLPEAYFTRMTTDVNTIGQTNVRIKFWWVNFASPNAFGQLYYSTNSGGTWTLVSSGVPTLSGSSTWSQATVQLPVFSNQATLRFGFRFVNNTETAVTPSSPSLSIDNVVIEADGAAQCTAPTTQASAASASNLTTNSASINWTNGNGAGRIVMLNTVNSFANPAAGANPTANTTYTGGEQCVFNGTGSGPITVTGLTSGTNYFVKVFEYCSPDRVYNTGGTTNTTTFTTTVPASASITTGTIQGGVVCPGASILVPFTVNNGPMNAGNVFTLQMSDVNGSFASPTALGTLSSLSSGAISGTLPSVLAAGNGYLFRVVGSNPATTGSNATGTITVPAQTAASFSLSNSDLDVNATSTSTDATTYTWDPGDGTNPQTSTGTTFAYTYISNGTYTFCLTAANACFTNTSCQTITICDDLSADANITASGLSISVEEDSDGADSVYVDFGDGNGTVIASGATINHTYMNPGPYLLCVYATNICGQADTSCQTIVVNNVSIGQASSSTLMVYPNPSQGPLQLELAPHTELISVDILSTDGRWLGQWNSTHIASTGLQSGLYFIRITTSAGIETRTWILQ
jgi:PKD domain